jgi:hypothetical protein
LGNADHKGAAVFGEVIDAIGNGDTDGIGSEVMIQDVAWAAFPALAGILEVSYQFAFLGVDANNGQVTALKAVAQLGEIFKLEIAAGAEVGGDLLAIDAQGIAHLIEQAGDSVR